MHCHEFVEFFYVLQGQCMHSLDGTTNKITSGDAYLLTPNNIHHFKNLGTSFLHRDIMFKNDYFKSVCDMYSLDLYDNFTSNLFSKQIKLTSEQINQLESFIQPISLNNDTSDDIFASTICTFIINAVLEQNLDFKTNYPIWITRLLSLLSAPENFNIDQQMLLSPFPYSQEYICRTFKKLIGKTITDYFNEQKMKYAHSLLHSSSYSIEQICTFINFNNVSYFYRLFKKHFNITPREVIPSPKNNSTT